MHLLTTKNASSLIANQRLTLYGLHQGIQIILTLKIYPNYTAEMTVAYALSANRNLD